ncbi:MAG: YgiQ family radical SAM protein [Bacteroidota bacterium]|nr:YgiQ family radical SAM protein [Bacteroidota bacterium]
MRTYDLKQWLPTTKKEMELRGWDSVDVILFSGDAYVDHPSFGIAVVGRILESEGLRVAIVPQPNWRDDLRDFKKLGRPNLFFGISAGCMDSMVNHYTANKRLRSDDAYTPDGKPGMRPDMPTIVYSNILKEIYPDVPIMIGGIEASLRRLSHYDYWEDRLRPSILADCKADLLVDGMGEQPLRELLARLNNGESFSQIRDLQQTAYLVNNEELRIKNDEDIELFPHEECLKDKLKQAKNFRHIEEESNAGEPKRILQRIGKQTVVVNPPYPTMTSTEIDASFDLPYTRLPHPKYKGKTIPAYEMIKFSVNLHRGCFGGCAFCTISAHQGKAIASRSKDSIINEVKKVTQMEDFKGYLSDLGGPSANMYRMQGKDLNICRKCRKPSCISPVICKNLNTDHRPLLDIYKAVDVLPGMKKSFIGSGVRYDLLLHRDKDEAINNAARQYTEELIANHVSGRLKVAPEHTSDNVLKMMRKPSFRLFEEFKRLFDRINDEKMLRQQLIPYFISSHPGCGEPDMAELAAQTRKLNFHLEQVQDFTPTPMTLATEMFYTGYHPYTLEKVFTAHSKDEKLAQRQYFFWYQPEYRQQIVGSLRRINRPDLIDKLYGQSAAVSPNNKERNKPATFDKTKAKVASKPFLREWKKGRR